MKLSRAIQDIAAAAAALGATAASAHPGHASGGVTTLRHLLTEPDHVLMLLAVAGVGIAAVVASRRGARQDRRHRKD